MPHAGHSSAYFAAIGSNCYTFVLATTMRWIPVAVPGDRRL